jgi:hypothetical protein
MRWTTARLRRLLGRPGTRLSHRGRQTAGRAIVIFTQWDREPVIGKRACVSSCRRERKWGMTFQIPERLPIQPPCWGAITRIARVSFRNKGSHASSSLTTSITVAVSACRGRHAVHIHRVQLPRPQPSPNILASHIASVHTRIFPQVVTQLGRRPPSQSAVFICSHIRLPDFSPLADQYDVPMQRLWSPSAVGGTIRSFSQRGGLHMHDENLEDHAHQSEHV